MPTHIRARLLAKLTHTSVDPRLISIKVRGAQRSINRKTATQKKLKISPQKQTKKYLKLKNSAKKKMIASKITLIYRYIVAPELGE
jgi:hypothetical protein